MKQINYLHLKQLRNTYLSFTDIEYMDNERVHLSAEATGSKRAVARVKK